MHVPPSPPPPFPLLPPLLPLNTSTRPQLLSIGEFKMGINTKLSFAFLLFSVFFLSLTLSLVVAGQDPELLQCKRQCSVQHRFSQKERQGCEQKCEDYYKQKHGGSEEGQGEGGGGHDRIVLNKEDPEKQLQQCQKQCERQRGHEKDQCRQQCQETYERQRRGEGEEGEEGEEGGGGHNRIVLNTEDPEKQLQQCQKQCERQKGHEKEQCRQQCQETYERQRGEEGEEGKEGGEGEEEGEGERQPGEKDKQVNQQQQGQGQGQEKQQQNPYVIQEQHFITSLQSSEGKVKIYGRFDQGSHLLSGLKNYNFLWLEANPHSFVLPSFLDAEAVIYIVSGRGTMTMVRQGRRESFNVRKGDIVRLPSGTTIYMINKDQNKKFRFAELVQPVNIPDEFRVFFPSGGENPHSLFNALSPELLSTALKTDQSRLQRVISRYNKGDIIKASERQIQALSQREEGGIFAFPFGASESKRVHNLLDKEPSISNSYGRLYQVDANEFEHLRDMDVAVSFANITKGAIEGPFFNTRSTKIAVVLKGDGYMEMACPHSQQQQQPGQQQEGQPGQKSMQHFQKLSASLKREMILVIPPGHATIIAAGNERNLEIMCFEINAENNWRETLAGDKNLVSAWEKEAKELAFGVPAKEVDEVFGKQRGTLFFPGTRGGRSSA